MTKFTKVLSASLLASTAFAFSSHASVVINVEEVAAPKSVFVSKSSAFSMNDGLKYQVPNIDSKGKPLKGTKTETLSIDFGSKSHKDIITTNPSVVVFPKLVLRDSKSKTVNTDKTDYSVEGRGGATCVLEEDQAAAQLAALVDVVSEAKQEALTNHKKSVLEASKTYLSLMLEYANALKAAYKTAYSSSEYGAKDQYYINAITPVRTEYEAKLSQIMSSSEKEVTKAKKKVTINPAKAPRFGMSDKEVSRPFEQELRGYVLNTGFDLSDDAVDTLNLGREDVVAEAKRNSDLSDALNVLLKQKGDMEYALIYMEKSIKAEEEAAALAAAQADDSKGKQEEAVEEEK